MHLLSDPTILLPGISQKTQKDLCTDSFTVALFSKRMDTIHFF